MSSVRWNRCHAFDLHFLWIAIACLFMWATASRAQISTGDILGTVTDSSGAVVPNAQVTVTNAGTKQTRTARSNQAGEFTFSLLQRGSYSITVRAPGFKEYVLSNITLNAGDRRRQDVVMVLGSNAETVEVQGAPSGLETDTSVLSTIVTENQVQNLPLNGRNFVQLAQLAAGANEAQPDAISNGNRPDDRRQTSAISVDAQSDTLNNEMVDGLDNNERVIGTIGVRPSIDAIAEFRVQTNLYPAEVGKTPGAVVNIITKSGTNSLHGSAYEFLRNDVFDGRNFFATVGPKPEYRQNQFGASLGGPIRKDKTFFFGDYEGLRIVQGTTALSTVPTLFEEQNPGNLSDIGGPVIASGQVNPIALKYFALYPAPNLPGTVNNFTYSPAATQYSTVFDARVDEHFSDKNLFFVRYSYNYVTTSTPGGLPPVNGIAPGGSVSYPGTAKQPAQQALLDYVHIFNPARLLELKAGYTRIDNSSLPLNYGQALGNEFGIQNANLNQITSGLPNVSITGYAGLGDDTYLPLTDLDNIFQYSGSLTQTKGSHTFKFGAVLIRRQVQEAQNAYGNGSFSFITEPSTFPLANFFQGVPYSVGRNLQFYTPNLRIWEPSAYAEDDWRVTQRLTLNLGLRYDVITPDTEAHGYISNFNPATASLIVPGLNGGSATAGVKTDYRALAPRFGFAANLQPTTVLRGGYGLVYFRDDTAPDLAFGNEPFVYNYAPNPLSVGFSTPLPIPVEQSASDLSGALFGMQLTYRTSYVQQFNLNIEQDIGKDLIFTLGYVGELARHTRITPDIDLAPPGPNPPGCSVDCFVPRMPFYNQLPNVSAIYILSSGGYQNYNGLQTSLQKRLSNGLTLNANYTWSHAIGDTVGFSQGGLYTSAVPSQTATLERGNSDLDMRDRFTLMLNYLFPFGQSWRGIKGAVGKGWQVNAIDVWETGFPFSVVNSTPQSNTGISSDRPNQIASAKLSNPSINEWFNTAAFESQTFGTIGSARRDSVYGPYYRHLDLSFFKNFQLTQRFTLQARAEAFNILNTPNFSAPASTLGAPGFGTISSTNTISTPRELQFALHLSF